MGQMSLGGWRPNDTMSDKMRPMHEEEDGQLRGFKSEKFSERAIQICALFNRRSNYLA